MPPSRSGIADYSEALATELGKLVDLEIFDSAGKSFDPTRFDHTIYHLGNNPHHDFVYDAALAHPGVVVMHEANLHHLIAHVTIRRGDWDAYVTEAELNGGQAARARAELSRTLTVGPDYEGCTMTRRVLDRARGVIVHSRYMARELQAAQYRGPIATIPHGAWVRQVDGAGHRARLGIGADAPLIGVFGHLKPYKRIAESLRAFRRVVREEPRAKMILVGEPHPELPLEPLIASLGLDANVRVVGFAEIDDFVGYLAACDIVLNLRYPTVGESSGSLLRALGLCKAVLVSDVGSFAEFPDEVCLKVPVGQQEEELLFQYLRLLTSRLDLARALGERARAYVERECTWAKVAEQYKGFLGTLDSGQPAEVTGRITPKYVTPKYVTPNYIMGWAADDGARHYIDMHKTRLVKTLEITPPASAGQSVLEMGAYMQITPALKTRLGYSYVRGCYYGKAGRTDHKTAVSKDGERFECDIDLFDAERDPFPYPEGAFDTVVCGELIEHLFQDPMYLMSEVNRILKDGGHLVLTTPNIASLHGISAIMQRYHPGFFHAYIKPSEDGVVDARHNREYTPGEIYRLMLDSGFEVTLMETGPFGDEPNPEHDWVLDVLKARQLPTDLRGDGIYCVGRKVSGVLKRWPDWLYS
jgi:glycosyltransferase involved in cell wall biosynthesis/SAM-dependent methyltransferase